MIVIDYSDDFDCKFAKIPHYQFSIDILALLNSASNFLSQKIYTNQYGLFGYVRS